VYLGVLPCQHTCWLLGGTAGSGEVRHRPAVDWDHMRGAGGRRAPQQLPDITTLVHNLRPDTVGPGHSIFTSHLTAVCSTAYCTTPAVAGLCHIYTMMMITATIGQSPCTNRRLYACCKRSKAHLSLATQPARRSPVFHIYNITLTAFAAFWRAYCLPLHRASQSSTAAGPRAQGLLEQDVCYDPILPR
jgi:hypothetical protein